MFCLTVPKHFVGGIFSVSLIPGMEKIFASEGYVTIFCQSLFVSQCRKTLQRFINLRVSKNVRDKRKWWGD